MTDETEEQTTAVATVEQPFSGVLATQQSRAVFLPQNLAQAMELAHFMAGGIGVRQWMRGNPSACLALIQISMRWGLDPYIVANKAYYANDTLSFESQLVNAVINTSGLLIGRLKVVFSGDASGGVGKETLNCRVSGRLLADPDQVFVHEQALQTVKIRNSPLWTVNPKQQLQYHATRAWARLYMPEVLLGIYTPDEIADGVAARLEADSTPKDVTPAPDRRSFENGENGAEDAEFEEIQTVLPEKTAETEENSDSDAPEAKNDEETAQTTQDEAVPADNGGAEDRSSGQSSSGNGGGDPDPIEDAGSGLPVEPLEWAAWERETTEAIDKISDRGQFDRFRQSIEPALDQADDDLLGRIQDLLADKLTTLPE